MLDFSRFKYITFDCYGTLIDWETGILGALQPVLGAHGVTLADDNVLELYAGIESRLEQGPYRPYREVLRLAVREFGERLGFTPSLEEIASLSESIKNWPPFPDTVAALRDLSTRYKLAIISNIDDELFAYSSQHLQVHFADVITAEQVGSYKPSRNNFREAIKRLGVSSKEILHAAQSVFHDIVPAKELGIANVWVDRRASKAGFGATPPAMAAPDLRVTSLRELADLALSR